MPDRYRSLLKPKCLHKKVGYLGCYECPESGFVPMDLQDESITNKQDLLKDIKQNYGAGVQGQRTQAFIDLTPKLKKRAQKRRPRLAKTVKV